MCSAVSDSVTPWTTARQTPLSMGFFRQEYWSGLLLLTPDHLPDPGTEPRFPAGVFFTTESPGKPHTNRKKYVHFLNHQKPVGFLFMRNSSWTCMACPGEEALAAHSSCCAHPAPPPPPGSRVHPLWESTSHWPSLGGGGAHASGLANQSILSLPWAWQVGGAMRFSPETFLGYLQGRALFLLRELSWWDVR